MLLRYELVQGSGGEGKYRGGMGLRRTYRTQSDCSLSLEGSRFQSRPWGLAGGGFGAGSMIRIGDRKSFSGTIQLRQGEVVEITTPGGGGYGDIAERDAIGKEADRIELRV
jgi:N-methylhydantoinase B